MPEYTGTHIPIEFVTAHMDSWQAHLEKISPFLIHGENVWWTATESEYIFSDGVDSPNHPLPELLHFRDSSLLDVQRRRIQSWKSIIENNTTLPIPYIKIYGYDEEFLYTKEYSQVTVPDSQSLGSDETPEAINRSLDVFSEQTSSHDTGQQELALTQYDPQKSTSNASTSATDMTFSTDNSKQISTTEERDHFESHACIFMRAGIRSSFWFNGRSACK